MAISCTAVRKLAHNVSIGLLKRSLQTTSVLNMPAKEGDCIPSVDLYEGSPANKVNTADLCKGKSVIIFGVPGAFTPGCSMTHLPGFINRASELKTKGINEIVCISVNDPFVMGAWGKEHKAEGKVRVLADTNAVFTKAMALDTIIEPLGGLRSKRYSMVVKDGKICSLQVEPDGTGLSCSLAEHVKV